MNIEDVGDDELDELPVKWREGDKLENMFKLQRSLMGKLVAAGKLPRLPKPGDFATKEGQQLIRTTFYYIIEEVMETSLCMRNAKEWKHEETVPDYEHIKEEFAGDALHFFLEAMIQLGIDPDTMYRVYLKKNWVNRWRVETGY